MEANMTMPPIRGSILPFSYIEGLYAALNSCPKVKFKTYKDLPFEFNRKIENEEALKELYRAEYLAWRESQRDDPRLDIIILHDSDSGPNETAFLCEYEASHGVVSTTSVFAQIVGAAGVETYPIDFKALLKAQSHGSCFTYHCNAWETSRYNEALLAQRCNSDVSTLEKNGLKIEFFSPHGGVPSPDGRNNNSFFYPPIFERQLLWTHNRFAPSGKRYSDGGFIPRLQRGATGTDLRTYLIECAVVPNRVFILLHPQYYFASTRVGVSEIYRATPWLDEYWRFHECGRSQEYWTPLTQALQKLM
jgi:hypothetical protein